MGKVDNFPEMSDLPPLEQAREPGEDRRMRGNRLEVSFPVVATHKGRPILGFIEARNISWSGMLLLTNFPLDIDDPLVLEFTLPERDIPITVRAKVVHKVQETIPDEATRIGVVFKDIDPNVQKIIAGFVLEYLPEE